MTQYNLKNQNTGEIVGSADTFRGAWELAPQEVRDFALKGKEDGGEPLYVSFPVDGELARYSVKEVSA